MYRVLKFLFGWLLRLIYRPWTEGKNNVPKKGAFVFASNHRAATDSLFLPLVWPRKISFIGKSQYFTGKGLKGRFVAFFMRSVGVVEVDRSNKESAHAAVDTACRILQSGHIFGIYPEGTRSMDGRLYRGRTGVARIALTARVPVVPVGTINSAEAQPLGRKIPKRHPRVGLKFGKPLDFSQYYGQENDRVVVRTVTNEIMQAIRQLSGQEYVDVYPPKKIYDEEGNIVGIETTDEK